MGSHITDKYHKMNPKNYECVETKSLQSTFNLQTGQHNTNILNTDLITKKFCSTITLSKTCCLKVHQKPNKTDYFQYDKYKP